MGAAKIKKFTVHLPEDLVRSAIKYSDGNVTEAIRMGLKLIAARDVYSELLKMRGKVKFDLDIKKLREDD